MSYPLTLVEFKSWLESKNLNDIVGVTTESCECPIFNCLKSKNISVIDVFTYGTKLDSQVEIENPRWVERFIEEIDIGGERDVTASEALESLQIVNNLYICTVCNTYNPEGTNCGKKDNCPW